MEKYIKALEACDDHAEDDEMYKDYVFGVLSVADKDENIGMVSYHDIVQIASDFRGGL